MLKQKESENTESQKEANMPNTSNENKIQNKRLVDDLILMIDAPVPPLSEECRIKRIPYGLRQLKEQAYTPTTISIGPIHHCKKKFQIMETYKVRYLKCFLSRASKKLRRFVRTISKMEERIRSCYAETTLPVMHSDDFVKMMLVDAVFILELFHRYNNHEDWKSDDIILRDQMSCIRYDLVLLENQLPFFVLEKLYKLSTSGRSNPPTLIDYTIQFFDRFNFQGRTLEGVKIEHFTDLIRTFQIPQLLCQREGQTGKYTLLYTATQLHEAGVKFKVSSSKSLTDVTFESTNGVLEIPRLELYDGTETLIRNVMALEQFRYRKEKYVTDYFLFLDNLINTTKDMDFLCNEKIVINHLGDNRKATSFFNNLNTHISMPGVYSNYNLICKNLNAFHEKRWHRWTATLRHQYFSTPWRTASTIAAIILLVFTFIQTVCSIIQVVPIV